jgi:hypothetical protein
VSSNVGETKVGDLEMTIGSEEQVLLDMTYTVRDKLHYFTLHGHMIVKDNVLCSGDVWHCLHRTIYEPLCGQ